MCDMGLFPVLAPNRSVCSCLLHHSKYWFTASTSFANPAATIARALSDTFADIRPADVPLFIAAQFAGGIAATLLFRWLVPKLSSVAKDILVAHNEDT